MNDVRLVIHLHSTMYLFQPSGVTNPRFYFEFTFHYVSISTDDILHRPPCSDNLHSTMYLFQQREQPSISVCVFHLHSTMYLFQRNSE